MTLSSKARDSDSGKLSQSLKSGTASFKSSGRIFTAPRMILSILSSASEISSMKLNEIPPSSLFLKNAFFLCIPILSSNSEETYKYYQQHEHYSDEDFEHFNEEITSLTKKSNIEKGEKILIKLSNQQLKKLYY